MGVVCEAGSSPRGRGKPTVVAEGEDGHRLIPAWAGKTGTTHEPHCTPRAHPRVGGENVVNGDDLETHGGSSPRGRGKRRRRHARAVTCGLIPAWAGKTRKHHAPRRAHRAHPRVGGENLLRIASDRGASRLIPAWAGKT